MCTSVYICIRPAGINWNQGYMRILCGYVDNLGKFREIFIGNLKICKYLELNEFIRAKL